MPVVELKSLAIAETWTGIELKINEVKISGAKLN
jgi:hypothetical protein